MIKNSRWLYCSLVFLAFMKAAVFVHSMEFEEGNLNSLPHHLSSPQQLIFSSSHQKIGQYEGRSVTCLFAGPHLQLQNLTLNPEVLPEEVKKWAGDTCRENQCSKISWNVPYSGALSSLLKQQLSQSGFSEKAYSYTISLENMLKICAQHLGDLFTIKDNIVSLKPTSTLLMDKASKLYGEFNPTIGMPFLFNTTVRKVLFEGGDVFVYQNDNEGVDGIISCAFFNDHNNNNNMYVDSIYVTPAQQGKGIAKELLKQLLITAISKEVKNIYWETGINRTEAQKLYEAWDIPINGVEWRYQPNGLSQFMTFLPTVLGNNSSANQNIGTLLAQMFTRKK